MSRDTASIRDQLGNDPEIFPLLIPDYSDNVKIIQAPLVVELVGIGHGWVAGSDTNAIVGDWTGTADGEQLLVGYYPSYTTGAVFNPGNTFFERFRYDRFEDTTNTTATVDYTTNHRIDFTAGQIYQSDIIHKDGINVTSVIFSATITGTVLIEVSADGTNWETIVPDVSTNLVYPASTGLKYRITEDGASTATVSNVIIKVNG